MKNQRKVNISGRLFTQALKSALGSTGSMSRKDRFSSKENLPEAKENIPPVIEMPVETNSSLQIKDLNPRPLVEKNVYSSIREPWDDNSKFPAGHTDINPNDFRLDATDFGSSSSCIADPSDLHKWVENSCSAEFQKTLCMVPQNENDLWIIKNRLMALQKLSSNSHDQYSAIQSNGNMFPEMEHNLPGCWVTSNVLPQKSGNLLSSEIHGLKAMPVQNGKNKYDSPSTHEEEKLFSKHVSKLKDQKLTQETFGFPSEEKAVYRKSDGRAELASENKRNSLQKLPHQKNLQVELCKSEEKLWRKYLNEANVWGAFGCHPKSAEDYNDEVERHLQAALNHPKVKALGEIGLDYSEGFKNKKSIQKEVFRRQLKIAHRRKLPLVIHCRDADDDVIEIMHEVLPDDTVFHLHCFTGNWEKARKWLREFPKVFIGLTNLVTFSSAGPTHEVARKLPLDYLLLETDAPYFVPSKVPRSTRFSHPGMAIHVAARIAELKGIDIETVLRATSANTRCVYNLPRDNI